MSIGIELAKRLTPCERHPHRIAALIIDVEGKHQLCLQCCGLLAAGFEIFTNQMEKVSHCTRCQAKIKKPSKWNDLCDKCFGATL